MTPRTSALTDRGIRKLQPHDAGYEVPDGKVRGLYLRVLPSGTRSWAYRYKVGHRFRRVALGEYPSLTLAKARRAAEDLYHAVRIERRDPARERRAESEALTVADLADIFEREHLPKRKPATAAGFRQLRRHFEPALGRLPVVTVAYDDISGFHAKLGAEHPITANRAAAALSAMFTLAIRKGLRTDNPCKGVERFPEIRREVRFTEAQLARLGKALDEVDQERLELPAATAALRLLLLTGARRDEILEARWSELDTDAGTLRVVDHKTSRKRGPKLIMLGRAALTVLERLATERDPECDWIIPGRSGRLVGFARPWSRILKRARLSGRRPHDCRRTFASTGAELGYPEAVIGELLGHTPRTVTAGYTLPGTRAMRSAADAIAGAVDALLRGEPVEQTGKLLPFGRG